MTPEFVTGLFLNISPSKANTPTHERAIACRNFAPAVELAVLCSPPRTASSQPLGAGQTNLMQTKSKTDYTLFFCNLFLFGLLAFAFSIPFWDTDYFEKVKQGSIKHVLQLVLYIAIFIVLPLLVLSWTIIRFTVDNKQLTVIDWFGLRRRTFSISDTIKLTTKRETAPYRFKLFTWNNKYSEHKTLYVQTSEGKRLRIQSRYMKNFGQLNIAIRKASA